MRNALCRTATVVVAAVALAAPVVAQTDARAPSGAVFGGAGKSSTGRQDLSLSINLIEAYDQDVLARAGGAALSFFQSSGFYTTLTPQMDFEARGGRVQVSVTAGSSARYYRDLHEIVVTNHSAGVALTAQLTRGTSVSLSQGATYAPALVYGLFASLATPTVGDVAPSASNYVLDTKRAYAYSTGASLTHKITERAALSFDSGFRYSDFTGHDPGYLDVRSHDAGGRFIYSLNRDVKVRLGYTFRQGQYVGSPPSTEHNVDIGIDYSRRLSRTRRTTFVFSLGPTVANGTVTPNAASQDVRRQYRLIGNVALNRQMGRTWSVEGTYRRGLGYIEGFQSPVFTGAYAAAASGFLNRRTDVSLSAAYSTGESALTGAPSQFVTYTGDARLRVALNSMWATYIEYVFYDYQFNAGIQLPPGVPHGLTRNGVRAGLTMRIPLRHR